MLSPIQFVPINDSTFTNNSINIDNKSDRIPGKYIASSSSHYDNNTMPFQAFNKNTNNEVCWKSNTFPNTFPNPNQSKPNITNPTKPNPYTQTPYLNINGSYQGGGRNSASYFTTPINNVGNKNDVNGEWLQIQLPEPVRLSSYSILVPSQQGNVNFFPEKFILAGSNDGNSWTYIDFQDIKSQNYHLSDRKPISFDLNTIEPYNYYRLIIIKMPNNNTIVRINQFSLFGLPKSSENIKENFIGFGQGSLGENSLSPQFDNGYPILNAFSSNFSVIEPMGGPSRRWVTPARSAQSRAAPAKSAPAAPSMNNISITESGAGAITQASNIANDPEWNNQMAGLENSSNSYKHKCGTGGNPNKSLDSEAVDALNDLKNRTNDIKNKATNFENIYNDTNSNVGKEINRVLGILKQPALYSDLGSVSAMINDETAKSSKLLSKSDPISAMINDENARTTKLDLSQADITAKYSTKKATLTQRKVDLDGIITSSTVTSSDKQGKLNSLTQLKPNVDDNAQQLQPSNNALASSSILNQQRLNYLNDRVSTTRTVAVDNYENLYKAIILQNEMLEKNENEVKSGSATVHRKTEFISSSKSLIYNIYTKLMFIYYILVVLFAGFLVFSQKTWSFYAKITLFLLAIIYPFSVIHIETWLYNMWLYILSIISGSVYTYRSLL